MVAVLEGLFEPLGVVFPVFGWWVGEVFSGGWGWGGCFFGVDFGGGFGGEGGVVVGFDFLFADGYGVGVGGVGYFGEGEVGVFFEEFAVVCGCFAVLVCLLDGLVVVHVGGLVGCFVGYLVRCCMSSHRGVCWRCSSMGVALGWCWMVSVWSMMKVIRWSGSHPVFRIIWVGSFWKSMMVVWFWML